MNVTELPQFTITTTEATETGWRLHGEFNHLEGVHKGGGWLFVPWTDATWDGHEVFGEELETLDRATRQACISTRTLPPSGVTNFAWVRDYWDPWQIAMITDPNRVWTEILFQATDAFARRMPDGWRELEAAGDSLPEADQVRVPGAWDHEHCNICWERIGSGDTGYNDEINYWLCPDCFEVYARPHNIGFVRDGYVAPSSG